MHQTNKNMKQELKEAFENFKKDCPDLKYGGTDVFKVRLNIICPYSDTELLDGIKEMKRNILLLKADAVLVPELDYLVDLIETFNEHLFKGYVKGFIGINLSKLKYCKTLLAYTNTEYTEALLAIVDNLQDQMVDEFGFDKNDVFYSPKEK